jgi:hypothetical protein
MGFRNGDRASVLIGETIDAWEAAEGEKLGRRVPRLFRALAKLPETEKQQTQQASIAALPIHVLTPEEIPI